MENAPALTLHQAVLDNDIPIVIDLLYHQRANVNAKDSNGNTPLHIAAHSGFKHIIELLFEHSFENYRIEPEDTINVIEINNDGKTAYMIALDQGHREAAEFLKPETLAGYIAKNDRAHVKIMLDQGLDAHLKDKALLTASAYTKTEIATMLLAYGADINTKDGNGETPLHRASYNHMNLSIAKHMQEIELINVLLAHGAEVNAKSNHGLTPLCMAVMSQCWFSKFRPIEIITILLNHGADIHTKTIMGKIPLHFANFKETAELLLETGANVNSKDTYGNTPLHEAASDGLRDIVAVLLKHGADIHIINQDGQTAYMLAMEKGYKDIAQLLERYEKKLC